MRTFAQKARLLDEVLDAYVLFVEAKDSDDDHMEKDTEDKFWESLDNAYMQTRE